MPVTGNTELAPTKNDLIIELVQKELAAQSKVLGSGAIMDYSFRVGKGMQSILIPRLASFTPEDRASAVAGTNQSLQSATDQINLDQRKHIQWVIDSNDEVESSIDVEIEYAKRAVTGHGRAFDLDAFATMAAVSSFTAQGVAGDVTRDEVLAMRQELLVQNADESLITYFCSVEQYHNLLKVPEFSEMRLYGDQIIKSGQIGTLYGQPVIMSNLMPAGQIYAVEKNGIGFAFQRRPSMDERRAPEYGVGAMLKVIDQKYGFGGLELGEDSGKGTDAVGASESPLVVKLQA